MECYPEAKSSHLVKVIKYIKYGMQGLVKIITCICYTSDSTSFWYRVTLIKSYIAHTTPCVDNVLFSNLMATSVHTAFLCDGRTLLLSMGPFSIPLYTSPNAPSPKRVSTITSLGGTSHSSVHDSPSKGSPVGVVGVVGGSRLWPFRLTENRGLWAWGGGHEVV